LIDTNLLSDPHKPSRPPLPGGEPGFRQPALAWEPEEKLLARLRAGDERAYEELVRRYGGSLLALARLRLRNREDARDAVQETFLSVFRGLPRFRGRSSLSTWLHRILLNAVLMRIRTRRRRPETSLEEWASASGAAEGFLHPSSSLHVSAEAALIRAELQARVRSAVDSLPDSYRSVLALRDLQEMDTPAVARLLSTTPSSVRVRLHRARQALRARLSVTSATV
jgi:RNA polymerase sigma-70 factor, ECF subfamily